MSQNWNVRFSLGGATFTILFSVSWVDVSNAAITFSHRIGATFDYEMEELK